MRRLTIALLSLAACAPTPEPEVAARRQALDLTTPVLLGEAGDQAGTAVAGCPDGGFVAGAPGNKRGWLKGRGVGPRAPLDTGTSLQLGGTVACALETGGATVPALGGEGGVWLFPGGLVQNLPVEALAAHPTGPLPLVAAGVGSQSQTLFLDNGTGPAGVAFGRAGVWGGRELLLGDRESGVAWRLLFNSSAGVVDAGLLDDPEPGANSDFGRVVALGDVHPAPGVEAIVASPGTSRVHVFSAAGERLLTLAPPSPTPNSTTSFGAALLVEPGDAGGGLHALWIGHPAADTIHRFVGDAGHAFEATPILASRFGAALALEPPGLLVVGAPGYAGNAGAVYREEFATFVTPPVLDGIPLTCTAGASCRVNACQFGVCVGGVLCVAPWSRPTCGASQVCDPAAGCVSVPDSGVVEPDAGSRDAGSDGGADAGANAGTDAGARDAGALADGGVEEVRFEACGCHGGWAGPALLLALALLRRRQG